MSQCLFKRLPPVRRPLLIPSGVICKVHYTRGAKFRISVRNIFPGRTPRSRPPDHPRSSPFNLTYSGVDVFRVCDIDEPSKQRNFGKCHFFFKNDVLSGQSSCLQHRRLFAIGNIYCFNTRKAIRGCGGALVHTQGDPGGSWEFWGHPGFI